VQEFAIMPAKKTKKTTRGTRNLVGAVVLTASLSLFAIPDASAESGGQCASVFGGMTGSDDGSAGSGGCLTYVRGDFESPDGPNNSGGY
jgi:hypothetical protein